MRRREVIAQYTYGGTDYTVRGVCAADECPAGTHPDSAYADTYDCAIYLIVDRDSGRAVRDADGGLVRAAEAALWAAFWAANGEAL